MINNTLFVTKNQKRDFVIFISDLQRRTDQRYLISYLFSFVLEYKLIQHAVP